MIVHNVKIRTQLMNQAVPKNLNDGVQHLIIAISWLICSHPLGRLPASAETSGIWGIVSHALTDLGRFCLPTKKSQIPVLFSEICCVLGDLAWWHVFPRV
jgi:hypothetical protein